jgi:hypothetical protein
MDTAEHIMDLLMDAVRANVLNWAIMIFPLLMSTVKRIRASTGVGIPFRKLVK